MKTKKGKKVLAILMAALMVLGIMPMDWAVKRVNAAVKEYTFDATTLAATADREIITAGSSVSADGYIKTFGEVKKRVNSTSGAVTSTEVGSNGSSGYTFTVTGTADLTFEASSTGGSNTSTIGLLNDAGELVPNDVTEVAGTTRTSLTYTNLQAGTYKIVSPDASIYDRGARIYSISVTEIPTKVTSTYSFDATTLAAAVDREVITAGSSMSADGYIKTFGEVKKRVNTTSGAVTSTEVGSNGSSGYTFTVTGTADLTFEASSTGGSNTSTIGLLNDAGELVPNDVTEVAGTTRTSLTYTNLQAGTYKIVSPDASIYDRGARIYSITVVQTASGTRPPRAAWDTVEAPKIGDIVVANGKVTVPFTMLVGYDGADNVTITLKNSSGVVKQEKVSADTNGSVEFTPAASGDYTISIKASRAECEDKVGSDKSLPKFELPLATPSFQSATSQGDGKISLVWNPVPEASVYIIEYSTDGGNGYSGYQEFTDTSCVYSNLTVGQRYTFRVKAKRNYPYAETKDEGTIEVVATAQAQPVWAFSAFGQGVNSNTSDCGYTGSANDGTVQVWNLNSKGKLVPASTDGLAFYYTAIPTNKNFTLKAKVTVDSWTYTNGQEGFGMMAADRVGVNGDSTVFWNNSYMSSATKVEYLADAEGNITDDTTANKISMKLGIGSQEKTGVTNENLSKLQANDTDTVNNEFKSRMVPLETSCALNGAGTYNIIGNQTNKDATTVKELTTLTMTIQRNNTGYFVSYTDEAGNTTTKKYYDTEALDKLDSENVYVGFFASRTCKATFSDIELTTISPEEDAPKEEQPVTQVTPFYTVTSGTVANSDSYNLIYISNADGHVLIKDADGNVIADQDVVANKKVEFATSLKLGENKFSVTATPNEGYKPSEFEELLSYDKVEFTHTVTYDNFSGDVIYVGPEGTSSGVGTKDKPVDIYTAVKFAKPGQYIILLGGTYHLESTVKIERGVDGTADALITMMREPGTSESERPVLDFGGNCEGMVIAGDYWYIQGFDVTNSQNGKDGIRLSGSNVTLDNLHTYHNGNTGIQISRYISTDLWDDWPADNLVLNCTSYGNADAGYEDADGFAAKLTIGNGNVFDGCVAYNNADDGWDLFAKVETGSIGSVTIQNCVAFANGYLEDGTNAGNGNGFKLGGSSMTGYHKLINSVAFDNKAKGIDSNSCPDIQVIDCTTYNNGAIKVVKQPDGTEKITHEGANIALYTNDAANTDFMATGVLSYRTWLEDIDETFKFKGTQDASKVYQSTNYFWNYTPQRRAVDDANRANDIDINSWVLKIDTGMNYNTHVYAQNPIARNADGTINMQGLLVLTSEAKAGAVVGGVASSVFSLDGLSTTSGLIAPQTGDRSTAPFVFMIIISAAMAAGVYFYDKKRKAVVRR